MWRECLDGLTQRRDDGHRLNVHRHRPPLLRSDELDFLLTGFTAWHDSPPSKMGKRLSLPRVG